MSSISAPSVANSPSPCRRTPRSSAVNCSKVFHRAVRRSLNQVADGCQGIEEEMRIDLSAEGAELGFRRQFVHLLLVEVAHAAFVNDAHRINPPRDHHRDGFQQSEII